MCFSSYINSKLKLKLWWAGARKRKESAFFVTFIFFEGDFFNIWVLSQCVVYLINFQNIYNFTYQKTLLHTLLLLVFKIVEILQCIHNRFCLLFQFFKSSRQKPRILEGVCTWMKSHCKTRFYLTATPCWGFCALGNWR